MLQPFTDRFGVADETLADWNPLDYNPLWTQGPQSPFCHETDPQHDSAAMNWTRMSSADSQTRLAMESSTYDHQTGGRHSDEVIDCT